MQILRQVLKKTKPLIKKVLPKKTTSQYNSFYKNINEESAKIKAVVRNIKSSKIFRRMIIAVDRSYNSVVSAYNSWVN